MKILYSLVFATILLLFVFPLTVHAEESNSLAITVVVPIQEETQTALEPALLPVYPVSVQENRDGGRREIVRVYELREHEISTQIPRESFERDGFRFELAEIVRRDVPVFSVREHVETITINTQNNDMATVLQLLSPTLEFVTEAGYFGILDLDITTIQTERDGTRTSSSTVRTTREFPHLSSPDISLIPRTVTERGRTYELADVQWRQQANTAIDYRTLPTSFTAVATYTATVTQTTATGFTTTAQYRGTVSRISTGVTQYTAYFIGIPIISPIMVMPPQNNASTTGDSDADEVVHNQPSTNNGEIEALPPIAVDMSDTALTTGYKTSEANYSTIYEPEAESEVQERQWSGQTVAIVILAVVVVGLLGFIFKDKIVRLIASIKGRAGGTVALVLAVVMLAQLAMTQTVLATPSMPPYRFGGGERAVHFDETHSGGSRSSHSPMLIEPNAAPFAYQYGDFLGVLTVERLNRTVRIYAGATMQSMDYGGAHFSFTGLNQGNTGLIGHNRGNRNGFFSFVRHLQEGDILTLEARGITRSYAVTLRYNVNESDFSPLMQFGDNRLTLVTCVEYQSHLRRIAVAVEIFAS